MTTERPDRGAAAMAERLAGFYFAETLDFDTAEVVAAAILANDAVFLPDPLWPEGIVGDECWTCGGPCGHMNGTRPDAAELERLRTALREVLDRIDYINGADAREVLQRARAALQPEGSAPDGG